MTHVLSRRAAFGALAGASVVGVASCQPSPVAASALACPAAEIGRELAALVQDINLADHAWLRADPAHRADAAAHFTALEQHLDQRFEALSQARAASLPGALVQAMCASSIVTAYGLPAALEARFSRLMLSVVNTLEASGGACREDFAGAYYMPRELDAARCAAEDADPSMGPDGEIVALGAEAAAMIAAYVAKGGPDAEFPEFATEVEEDAFTRAFYAEMDRAYVLADQMCAMRALTLVGAQTKSRLAKQFSGMGYGEEAVKLAQSVCRDLECGVFRTGEG